MVTNCMLVASYFAISRHQESLSCLGSPLPINAGLGSLSSTAKRYPGSKGVVYPKFRGKLLLQRNSWYYAVDERSRLKEWHLWEILTEAKRSPKPFFDCGAKAAA